MITRTVVKGANGKFAVLMVNRNTDGNIMWIRQSDFAYATEQDTMAVAQ